MMIRITVAGRPNRGKTTIIQIIDEALQEYGIVAEIDDFDLNDLSPEIMEETFNRRVDAVVKRKIILEEKQLNRDAIA